MFTVSLLVVVILFVAPPFALQSTAQSFVVPSQQIIECSEDVLRMLYPCYRT